MKAASRGFSVTSGSAQSATQFFAFDPGPNLLGAYALGTFTATNTTQSFSVGIGYTTSQFIPVNAVKSKPQIQAEPTVSPTAPDDNAQVQLIWVRQKTTSCTSIGLTVSVYLTPSCPG